MPYEEACVLFDLDAMLSRNDLHWPSDGLTIEPFWIWLLQPGNAYDPESCRGAALDMPERPRFTGAAFLLPATECDNARASHHSGGRTPV